MAKVTKMTRPVAKRIAADVAAALKPVAEKYGMSLSEGGWSYYDTDITFKPKFAVVTDSGVPADFERLAPKYGLEPSDFGKTFTSLGRQFRITGIKPTRRQYPISGERVPDGKSYKFTAQQVVTGLGKTSKAKFSKGDRVTFKDLFAGKTGAKSHGTIENALPVGTDQRVEVFTGGQVLTLKQDELTLFKGKRTEDDIMADICCAYGGLSPENLTCDGELPRSRVRAKASRLNRWLNELQRELGRSVSEEESFDWWDKQRKAKAS